jgi:hypothetical protein
MTTLICFRSRTDVTDAQRRKGEQEIGRRKFDSTEAAMTWLEDKAKAFNAKGTFAMVRREGDYVDLFVLLKNSVTDIYRFAPPNLCRYCEAFAEPGYYACSDCYHQWATEDHSREDN